MDADKAWDSAQGIAKAINASLSAIVPWRGKLRDKTKMARIAYNVGKPARGLMSDWKPIDDIYEMRIDFGPGYRVYFAKYNGIVFIVTLGGDKSSQKTDIRAAQEIWKDVRNGIQEIRD
jgi:putative addiction module killer protein